MNPDLIVTVAIFLVAQTGLLVWKLSAIDTKQGDMKETLHRVESTANSSALQIAALPCRTCKQLTAGD